MEIKSIGKICGGQDGAIFNGYLFRFNSCGECAVYCLKDLSDDSVAISHFLLDKNDIISPHSNSVTFGNAKYSETDEFPLLYSNIYNNFRNSEDKMKGVTCVYRLERNGNQFSSTLVQLIEIGFTEDKIWASEKVEDIRPYGNFVTDFNSSECFAFTMRDGENTTRYFAFDIPDVNNGTVDEKFGVKRVRLEKKDIKHYFDCEYHRFIQGACLHDGIIYSVEGFTNDANNPPALRLIDTNSKKQNNVYYFGDYDLTIEPEFIDFENGICYYIDNHGNVYELTF